VKRVVLIVVAVLALAACGGGGGNSNTAQITKVWQDFFSGKVDISKKPALIENGAALKSEIDAIAQNLPAANTSAKVSSVAVSHDGKTATVVYTIYLGKTPVLKDQRGTALKQNGHWVIADSSLCGLLQLAGGKLPPVCQTP
jgi:hypothetical protein